MSYTFIPSEERNSAIFKAAMEAKILPVDELREKYYPSQLKAAVKYANNMITKNKLLIASR